MYFHCSVERITAGVYSAGGTHGEKIAGEQLMLYLLKASCKGGELTEPWKSEGG